MKLPDEHRRALRVIAECEPKGAPQAMLEAHGFKLRVAIDLVKAGLADARIEVVCLGRANDPGRAGGAYRSAPAGASELTARSAIPTRRWRTR